MKVEFNLHNSSFVSFVVQRVSTILQSEVQSSHRSSLKKREDRMYTAEGKKIVSTEKAPKAIGPYSQAILTENLVFTAGQVGLDPSTMDLVEGGVESQSRQVLTNLKH